MSPIGVPDFDLDLGRLHHVGVVVDDLDEAAEHFSRAYGWTVSLGKESAYKCRIDGVEHDTVQRLGMTLEGPPHVELLRAVAGSSVWRPTSGVYHLGFVVEDLSAASAELERRGAALWMGGVRDGECPAGTAYHRDRFGFTIELLDVAVEKSLARRFFGDAHHAESVAPLDDRIVII
ncbi:VOC family protein [Rhodococcus sp. CH91]|uniref:VOC family protein n=1 Tax=Rhodococcus sp. CH91 TaxID=2910256 RepID=UPI001F4B2E5B|nr:VOC family protein [Rhodococcus sp. CH91]